VAGALLLPIIARMAPPLLELESPLQSDPVVLAAVGLAIAALIIGSFLLAIDARVRTVPTMMIGAAFPIVVVAGLLPVTTPMPFLVFDLFGVVFGIGLYLIGSELRRGVSLPATVD